MVFGFCILASDFFLALTPIQRWEAASGKFNVNFMADRWFILIGVIVLITLTALLLMVNFNRARQQRKDTARLFVEYAEQGGLSTHERQILFDIANKAGLKRNESIFTLASAFDRGAVRMQQNLADRQTSEQKSWLREELSLVREKLGFGKWSVASAAQSIRPEKLSSRQIPTGKELYIKQQKDSDSDRIACTVIANNDSELMVELANPVKITFGQFWCVRYYFSSSVWEFDASVVSYDGNTLVLNHSDNVRLINRRRFLRVPVRKPAFVAHFPFSRSFTANGHKSMKSFKMYRSSASTFNSSWEQPEFVPAVVTELAGPGLRIESTLEVKTGERVLVAFSLNEEQGRNSTGANVSTLKIVENIAEVRHTSRIPNGLSIAIELTGLRDSDINELTRATNAASVKTSVGNENAAASNSAEERMEKPVVAQGV